MVCLKYIFLLTLVTYGYTAAQSEPTLKDVNNYLPPELQDKVDEAKIQTIGNKTKELFKEKCDKNGGPTAFPNLEQATKNLKSCLESTVNVTALEKEVEDAKPNGKVDEVFKKYCQKTPELKGCFRAATDAAKPCFSSAERGNLNTIYNVTEQLAEFVCFKEGDRIALFIAEGGKECFETKQPDLQDCFNKTFNLNETVNPNELSLDNIPQINFGEKECGQMTTLQTCVVGVLETCAQPTSANIVESLFKFIRKSTPCKNFEEPSAQRGAAGGLAVALMTLAGALTASMLV